MTRDPDLDTPGPWQEFAFRRLELGQKLDHLLHRARRVGSLGGGYFVHPIRRARGELAALDLVRKLAEEAC